MYRDNLEKSRRRRNTLLIILAILLIVATIEAVFIFAVHSSNNESDKMTEEIASGQTVRVETPTATKTDAPTLSPTPTERPTPTPTEEPRKIYKVAIDAGHQLHGDSNLEPIGPGSSEKKAKVSSGASGVSTGVPEYQLNLDIAKKLKAELEDRGYEVYMIRTRNDIRMSNIERAKAANDSGADIYIRIHADGIDDSSVCGASALYPTLNNPYVSHLSKQSKKLSECVLNEYCDRTGIRNRGLSKRDDLTGTNWSEIPVTLLEMGFMSNPSEDELMQESSMQSKMAAGIADGVDRYFND